MTCTSRERPLALREAVTSLLAPEVTGPLDELADVLVHVSAMVSKLRRRSDAEGRSSCELSALDASFTRSIVLTRLVRERVQARRGRSEYASVSCVAREVVGLLQEALPDGVVLSLRCPEGPAIVAADASTLRKVLASLLESAIDAVSSGGRVDLVVSEVVERAGREASVAVRARGLVAATVDPSSVVGAGVRALGGTLAFREASHADAEIAIRLPLAC